MAGRRPQVTAVVIDASVVAAALMPDEGSVDLDTLRSRFSAFLAPRLLWIEVRNLAVTAERRGRMSAETGDRMLSAFDHLEVSLDAVQDSPATMNIARRHGLTAYDAIYLVLALRDGAALATLDKKLAAAARAEGVDLA